MRVKIKGNQYKWHVTYGLDGKARLDGVPLAHGDTIEITRYFHVSIWDLIKAVIFRLPLEK